MPTPSSEVRMLSVRTARPSFPNTSTEDRSKKTLTLEAGATPFSFKVPANAKRGKQQLVLTVGAITKSVTIRVI